MTAVEDDIRSAIRSARIPSSVLSTTLPKEGENALRDYVLHRRYKRNSEYLGIYLYPSTLAVSAKARKAFFLVAKEMILSRVSVYCTTLSDLAKHLSYDYDDDDGIESADVLFIADFYEQGAPMPLDAKFSAMVRSWIRGRLEKGKGICLLADSSPNLIETWWPSSFRTIIEGYLEVFRIEAKR